MNKNENLLKITKKHPFLRSYMMSKVDENSMSTIEHVTSLYIKYKTILKGKVDFGKNVSLERFSDNILMIINEHQLEKFLKNNLSKKHLNILTDEAKVIIESIYHHFEDKSWLGKDFFSNVSACTSSDDLLRYVKQYHSTTIHFNKQNILDSIDETNNKLYIEDGNTIIMQILNYDGIKNIGSNKWCIVNYQDYYEYYLEDLKRQYIIFNFNKEFFDPYSMVGVTVNHNGEIVEAYDKNNQELINAQFVHDHCFPKLKSLEILEELASYKPSDALIMCIAVDRKDLFIQILNNTAWHQDDLFLLFLDLCNNCELSYADIVVDSGYIDFDNICFFDLFIKESYLYGINKILKDKKTNIEYDIIYDGALKAYENQADKLFQSIILWLNKKDNTENRNLSINKLIESLLIYSDVSMALEIIIENFKNIKWEKININVSELLLNQISDVVWNNILPSKDEWIIEVEENRASYPSEKTILQENLNYITKHFSHVKIKKV